MPFALTISIERPVAEAVGRLVHGCRALLICAVLLGEADPIEGKAASLLPAAGLPPGLSYTNQHTPKVPWSVHVVRVSRTNSFYELHAAHANGGALGLTPLTAQIERFEAKPGAVVAGINGDFYQRDRAYAGDPRGLQIVKGEVISAPNGGVAFWIGPSGDAHAAVVEPLFQIVWPDGRTAAFGLNGERQAARPELYTPALGSSTRTTGGREFVLEGVADSPWLPLRMAETYTARVREVRETGDSALAPDTMVLSLSPGLTRLHANVAAGAVLKILTASAPSLSGARTGIGGGPVLVRAGRRQRIVPPPVESYEFTSMLERHPRTAIGWNRNEFFLVQVDGRQRDLSVGMTLVELAAFLIKLGCLEAMNLDGGGSATFWYDGKVRNSPCDGRERAIANSLLVVRRTSDEAAALGPASAGSR